MTQVFARHANFYGVDRAVWFCLVIGEGELAGEDPNEVYELTYTPRSAPLSPESVHMLRGFPSKLGILFLVLPPPPIDGGLSPVIDACVECPSFCRYSASRWRVGAI